MILLARSRLSTVLPWAIVLALASACEDDRQAPTGIDLTAMAPNADPCQDFYAYACGGWIAQHPVPDDASRVTRVDDAYYRMVPILRDIIEKDAAGMVAADDPDGPALGRYYQGCLNAPQDPRGRAALAAMLGAIDEIQSLDDLARVAAAQAKIGSGTFFSIGVTADVGDPTQHVLRLDQGGIEMARYRYLDPTEAATVSAYSRHIDTLANFFPASKIDPIQVLQIETALAQAALAPDDRSDPRMLHHRMSLEEVAALAPTFAWSTYWQALGVDGLAPAVDVAQPGYLTSLDALLQSTPLPALKMYMAWQLIEDKAARMDDPILSEDFDFWGRIVNEIATQQPRQWICYQDTVRRFGGSLARPYIARHYSNDTTDEVTTMITRLRTALAGRITNMWLDGPTQAEAQAKLKALGAKVGHPNHWPTLDGLALSGSYADDDLQIDTWATQLTLDSLTQPVDHSRWATTPVVVNAFYSPIDNAITIPAGILQLPFFGAGYSGASNYGAIGAVLGHELTHGFDSWGRLFDGTGRLRDWWTPETAAAFESRVQCVIDQYASSEVVPGVSVDGRLTLPENIADLGGLNLAYDAWTATAEHERPRGGLDDRQQFFVAYAQTFCSNARTAYLETLAETDPHAPARQRVNQTLANIPAAGRAFSCALGTPLAPTTPCAVW